MRDVGRDDPSWRRGGGDSSVYALCVNDKNYVQFCMCNVNFVFSTRHVVESMGRRGAVIRVT